MNAAAAMARLGAQQAITGGRVLGVAGAITALSGLPLLSAPPHGSMNLEPTCSVAAWGVLIGSIMLGASRVSGERRAGTWDLVLAAPDRPAAAVWGLGLSLPATSALLAMGLALQAIVASWSGPVDLASAMGGMLGLWLLGMAGGAAGLVAGVTVRSGLVAMVSGLLGAGAWVFAARSLQVLGDPWWGAAGYALDPIRRVQEFASGAFELGGVIAMLAASLLLTWLAARWCDTDREPRRVARWRARVMAVVLCGLALPVTGVLLRGPGVVSPRVDLQTVAPAWPDPSLREVVAGMPDPARVVLLRAGAATDPLQLVAARQAMRRLASCVTAGGQSVQTHEVDLLALDQAADSARVMEWIEAAERQALQPWREAVTEALDALDAVASQGDLAKSVRRQADARSDGAGPQLRAVAAAIQRAVAEHASWRRAFEEAAMPGSDRPLGDWEGTGRGLAQEMRVWAGLLQEAGDELVRSQVRDQREAGRGLVALADRCRRVQDRIDRLPPLRVSEVAAAMASPPVLVLVAAEGVAAVPAWRLLQSDQSSDRVLVDAILSARGAPRRDAVVMHAWPQSPLQATPTGSDLAFMAEALRGARFRVQAWNPSEAPRPAITPGSRRVWLVVPPLDRRSLEPGSSEAALLDAARRLLQEGQPVMVLAPPSVAAAMGMADPWSNLLDAFGITAQTQSMVVQLTASSEAGRALRRGLDHVASGPGPMGGLAWDAALWPSPVPLLVETVRDVRSEVVAQVPPDPSVWVEDDPRVITRGTLEVPAGKGMTPDRQVPLLAVAERGDQRVAMAGGAAWPLSSSAAVTDGRGRLTHPGNRALLVGTARWLAGEPVDAFAAGSRPEGRGAFAVAWLPPLSLIGLRLGVLWWRRRA